MKPAIVVGARPQFIKLAPLHRAFLKAGISPLVIHTGQHYDWAMSQSFFDDLRLPKPDYELAVDPLWSSAQRKRAMVKGIVNVLAEERPDWVIVFGDTDSTLAGALAANELGIRLAHVEAGLRSGNLDMPEETNRIETDRMSELLFVPTQAEQWVLQAENIEGAIVVSGDIMLDAYLHHQPFATEPNLPVPASFCLATLHRNFNTDQANRLSVIMAQLSEIHGTLCPILLPVHPRLRRALERAGRLPSIHLLPPQPYLVTLWLIRHSVAVITDSGGLQKEAYFANKPCIVARSQTEWRTLVDHGYSRLSAPSELFSQFQRLLAEPIAFSEGLLGDGRASTIIVDALMNYPTSS